MELNSARYICTLDTLRHTTHVFYKVTLRKVSSSALRYPRHGASPKEISTTNVDNEQQRGFLQVL
jgi:hypothetical protein